MSKALGQQIGKLRGAAHRREIEKVVARWREWDGTQGAFCASIGISTQSLNRWRKTLGAESMAPAGFVEVTAPSLPSVAWYEIVLASGVSVRAPSGFDDDAVARLLTLARASC